MTYGIDWSGKMPKNAQRTQLITELKQLASVYHSIYFGENPPIFDVFDKSYTKRNNVYIHKDSLRKITDNNPIFEEKTSQEQPQDIGSQFDDFFSNLNKTNKQKRKELIDKRFQVDFVKISGVQFKVKQRYEVTRSQKNYISPISFTFIDYLVVKGVEITETEGMIINFFESKQGYTKGLRFIQAPSAEHRNWDVSIISQLFGYIQKYYNPNFYYCGLLGYHFSPSSDPSFSAMKILKGANQEEDFALLLQAFKEAAEISLETDIRLEAEREK